MAPSASATPPTHTTQRVPNRSSRPGGDRTYGGRVRGDGEEPGTSPDGALADPVGSSVSAVGREAVAACDDALSWADSVAGGSPRCWSSAAPASVAAGS